MTLILEDGSGVTNSNTYVDDAEYVAYALARGKTIGSDATAREIELIKSMDFLEGHRDVFKGMKTEFDQSLQWPRSGVFIDSFQVDFDSIPEELKRAQMESAIILNSTEILKTGDVQNVSKEQLDVLSVEYFNGGSWTNARQETVSAYLNVLLITSSIGVNARVFRA